MTHETKILLMTIALGIIFILSVIKLRIDSRDETVVLFQNNNGQIDTLRFERV